MSTLQISTNISGGGISLAGSVTRTADGNTSRDPTLPAGKAGTLTTRTDANTGVATLGSGHGILDADVVDVYWDGGMRYGMVVGTVAGLAVPIDGGTGTDLPSTTTALVVTKQVTVNLAIDGDRLTALGLKMEYSGTSTAKGHVGFFDATPTSVAQIDTTANEPRLWDVTGGSANPFTGNPITSAKASNGSSTAAATLKLIWGEDSTP